MRIKDYIKISAYAGDWLMLEVRGDEIDKDISQFEDTEYHLEWNTPIRNHLAGCRTILLNEKKWLTRRKDEIILKAEKDMKANIYQKQQNHDSDAAFEARDY